MTIPLLKYADVGGGGGDCSSNDSQQAITASVARQRPSHFPVLYHPQHAPHHHAQHHHQGGTVDLHNAVVQRRAVSDVVDAVRFPAAHAITSSVPVPVPVHPSYQHQHPHGCIIIPTPTAAANVNNVNINHIIINNNDDDNNDDDNTNTNTNTKNSSTSFNISRPVGGGAIPVRLPFVPVLERPPTYNNNNNNNNNVTTASIVNEKHQHHAPVPLNNNSDPHIKQQQQRPAVQLSSSTNDSKIEVIDVDIIGGDCCDDDDDDESTKSKIYTSTSSSNNNVKSNNSVIIKKSKKRRRIFVEDVTEWRIPIPSDSSSEVVVDKYGFIVSSLQKGLVPDSISIPHHPNSNVSVHEQQHKQQHKYKQQQQQNDLPSNMKMDSNKIIKKKKKKNHKKKETTTKMEFPKVINAEFDNRFLEYKLSSDGIMEQKDILVRSLLSFSNNVLVLKNNKNCQNIVNKPWENNNDNNDPIEVIPDEPPRSNTSSRVGPQYAAEITPKLNDNDDSVAAAAAAAAADATSTTFENSSTLPGYDTLWDPKLAKAAEERGEDISGFLEGEHELCNHELLFSILHNSDYCVKSARIDYKRVQGLYDGCTTSKLNRDESKKFDVLIKEKQKDFSLISKTLKRKRSDCLSHYYVWKATNRLYPRMKRDWKEHCFLCDEGGDLMVICDGCNHSFHMTCAKPPLTSVPEGDWFCHLCTEKKGTSKRDDNLLSPILSPRGSVGIRRLSLGSKVSPCGKSAESGGGLLDGIENSKSTPSGRKTLYFA